MAANLCPLQPNTQSGMNEGDGHWRPRHFDRTSYLYSQSGRTIRRQVPKGSQFKGRPWISEESGLLRLVSHCSGFRSALVLIGSYIQFGVKLHPKLFVCDMVPLPRKNKKGEETVLHTNNLG
jgi:hypothetical protein